jgi:hypothetical protein
MFAMKSRPPSRRLPQIRLSRTKTLFGAVRSVAPGPKRHLARRSDLAAFGGKADTAAVTHFTMLVRMPRKDTTTVVAALAKHIGKLPEELRRSLTWDQGKEMHAHKRFTVATNVQVYFCGPRSPWQRGSNENTRAETHKIHQTMVATRQTEARKFLANLS